MTDRPRRHAYNDDRPAEALACLAEVAAVLAKHGYALSHEDGHGACLVRSAKR